MEIVKVPSALPGCCFICNSTNRDSFIDTKMSLDVDGPTFPGPLGAVYICNMCVNEFAVMYGYLSKDQYRDLRKSHEELESINFEAIKRIGALEESLSAMVSAGYKRIDDGRVVRNGGAVLENVEPTKQEPLGGTEKLGTRKRKTSKSSNDEGVGELHADDSDSSSDYELEF
jgi:hypothetical protein